VLVEAGAFPSDQYAVETQIRCHGYDPADAIVEIGPRPGERLISEADILTAISTHGDSLALVLLGRLNYYTGELKQSGQLIARFGSRYILPRDRADFGLVSFRLPNGDRFCPPDIIKSRSDRA